MEIKVKIEAPELAQAIQSLAGALTKNPNLIDLEDAKPDQVEKETTKEASKTESEPKQEKEHHALDLQGGGQIIQEKVNVSYMEVSPQDLEIRQN